MNFRITWSIICSFYERCIAFVKVEMKAVKYFEVKKSDSGKVARCLVALYCIAEEGRKKVEAELA